MMPARNRYIIGGASIACFGSYLKMHYSMPNINIRTIEQKSEIQIIEQKPEKTQTQNEIYKQQYSNFNGYIIWY